MRQLVSTSSAACPQPVAGLRHLQGRKLTNVSVHFPRFPVGDVGGEQ